MMKIRILISVILAITLSACTSLKKVEISEQQQFHQQMIQQLKNGLHIYFAQNSSELDDKSQNHLKVAAEILRTHRSFALQIDGYTDSIGSVAGNQKVSLARANTVRNILVMKYQVNPQQLFTQGYGSDQPIATNDTEEGRALNRRVNLTLKIQ